MRYSFLLPVLALLPALIFPALAAELPAGTVRIGDGTVADVPDGETLWLADGRIVVLAGVQAPKPVRPDPSPAAEAARSGLAELVLGRAVTLHVADRDRSGDRHGRTIAHVVRDDGLWIQDAMLRRGLVRRYSQADLRGLSDALSAAEGAARSPALGLWADGAYAVRDAARDGDWRGEVGRFHVMRGRVLAAERRRDRVYLNFGADWRRDVTVEIAARDLRLFKAAGLDPLTLKGRVVEVRGWVESANGPLIRVTHPEQIARLAE